MPKKTTYKIELVATYTLTKESLLGLKAMQEEARIFAGADIRRALHEGDAEIMAQVTELDTTAGLINETEQATPVPQELGELGKNLVKLGEALQDDNTDTQTLAELANNCGLDFKFTFADK